MGALEQLSTGARQSLESWHRMVAAGDMAGLPAIVTDDIAFRSPFVFKPYSGKPAFVQIIRT
jgi:ketosteroid isomerase-like protein